MKSNLGAVDAAISGALKRKNEAAATTVEGNVKRRTPVDTGRLRGSITHDSDESGFVVGTNVTYANFVHNGTRYIKPNPFLVDGLLNSISDLRRIYGG
jgi:phage gpG-like protein